MLRSHVVRVGQIVGLVVVLSVIGAAPAAAQSQDGEYGCGIDGCEQRPEPQPGGDPYGSGIEPEPAEPVESGPAGGSSGGGSAPDRSGEAPRANDDGSAAARSSEGSGGDEECSEGGGGDQGSATPLKDSGNVASIALARTGIDAWLLPLLAGASIGAGAVIATQRRSRAG